MTWQRDGSGLEVKRVRGMTLNHAFVRQARDLNAPRETKRQSVGYLSEVDLGRCAIRMARKRRRSRRAERLAKAAARRAWWSVLRVVNRSGVLCLPERARLDVRTCGSIGASWVVRGSEGIEYEFSLGTGDKSIVGEVGHALGS